MITAAEIVLDAVSKTGVSAATKVPRKPPDVFIRVDAGTANRINLEQYESFVIVQVYGRDLETVLSTLEACHERLERVDIDDVRVDSWEEATNMVDFPDPDYDGYRWQLTGDLIFTLS